MYACFLKEPLVTKTGKSKSKKTLKKDLLFQLKLTGLLKNSKLQFFYLIQEELADDASMTLDEKIELMRKTKDYTTIYNISQLLIYFSAAKLY